ncbi:MAG: peroxide stress protein YaaA [Bacteroidales bacterium]|jgi:cytoplasmic iron level regulating protein YaaA (DUF328/UPF0246 family)|nr:peroxide stress protein YaaA [Bacteroidales bacterium]MDI9592204.1 peroxide stress protein YaaA [Bacteroidota bacterium]HOF80995.1 peroxide stress protein YaaA [Bacteroidales bacterium]HOR76339.1 peroxide stress protein YaaA [Bacteroidales bacterium]HPL11848.1 peroxide stress protein YaaA [Bacteroidales bacterium]
MHILLSPSKTLNEQVKIPSLDFTQPHFLKQAAQLVEILKKISPSQIQRLMNVNPKLADLNALRYLEWGLPFTIENALPAVLMFKGEVYNGLKAETLTDDDLEFAQEHLRILSGLYGLLRPLDLIKPYRLEMGAKLKNKRGDDLYQFWGDSITNMINEQLKERKAKCIINLASDEYFRAIKMERLEAEVITPQFKDFSGGSYKFITVYGKKARGMMARYIITNRLENVDEIKLFDSEGYHFNQSFSDKSTWVFTRG